MAKDDQQEAFERLLSSTLSRTIDFVKFGETKNAALLTFSSAWILASVNLRFGANALTSTDWQIAISIALPLFSLSGLISMFSFLPRLNLKRLAKDPNQEKSLLYFGDIASFPVAGYIERMRTRYIPPECTSATEAYLDDLATQIAVNSTIALRKYNMFKVGGYFALLGLTSLGVPSSIHIIRELTRVFCGTGAA